MGGGNLSTRKLKSYINRFENGADSIIALSSGAQIDRLRSLKLVLTAKSLEVINVILCPIWHVGLHINGL